MSTPFIPTAQPQPNTATYPIFPTLNLLGDFNKIDNTANATNAPAANAVAARAAYKAAKGVEAPDFDPTFKDAQGNIVGKYWEDDSVDLTAPDDIALYEAVNPANGTFTQVKWITNANAARPNIPGRTPLPAYVIAPTPATTNGVPYGRTEYLVSVEDALKLAAEWGLSITASQLVDMTPVLGFQANGETRREWGVPFNGVDYPAGPAIAQQNENGLNADGSWSTAGTWSLLGGPTWNPAPIPDDGISKSAPAVIVPIPVRKINTMGAVNEKFVPGIMPGVLQIARTDIQPVTPGTGGGITPYEHDLLVYIAAVIYKAVPSMGPPPTS